jgi:uncharacterized protein YkwD
MNKFLLLGILSLLSINSFFAQQQNPFPGFYEQFKTNAINQSQQLYEQQRYADSVKYYKLDIQKLNDYVFAALNDVRVSHGLKTVSRYENAALIDSCDAFANYLVTNDVLGHAGGNYDAEICHSSFAELSSTLKNDNETEIYQKIANDMVDGWMNSAPHKAIILKNDYTKVIVSTAKDDYPGAICGFDLRGVIRFYY